MLRIHCTVDIYPMWDCSLRATVLLSNFACLDTFFFFYITIAFSYNQEKQHSTDIHISIIDWLIQDLELSSTAPKITLQYDYKSIKTCRGPPRRAFAV